MNRIYVAMIGSVVALCAMIYLLANTDSTSSTPANRPLMFFCAASNRAVMEAIRKDYQAEYDRKIQIQYGASQTLLSSIAVSRTGDLYLPADESYIALAQEKDLIEEVLPIAKQQLVIAVRKGNPKGIENFDDLLRDGVRVVQANPDAAAVGRVARRLLREVGLWDALDKATTAYRGTVTEVANDITIGAADAGLVYDAVLHTYDDLEPVEIPEFKGGASQIAISVIKGCQHPQAALHFARYVSAVDRGLKNYQEFGFRVAGGDQWKDVPEISIFAGSMLQPAIEETIAAFEKREGIRVNRVYDGCGILVGQMKAGQHPDAYFACDSEFMTQVADLFSDPVPVSQNELAILVKKGNPHNITTLRDLTKAGLRVGIGHEKQCAMGWITQNTLKEGGVQQEVIDNVTVQTTSGDMLVNQLRAGSLDAAVAYLSNAAGASEFLDAYAIEEISCSTATQPWAVARNSRYPNMTSRLFERIISAESQQIFTAEGFQWQLGKTE